MNELRMYVEHLFEGKVLTPETIELKEEIYGNLMARYEDYVAQGLSEADALARTKASITDMDDMMTDDAASAADDALSSVPTTVIPPAAETVKMPVSATEAAASATAPVPGAPVAPENLSAAGQPTPGAAPKEQSKWIKTIIIAAAVILGLLAIGYGVNEFILDPLQDHQEDVAEAQAEQQWREQQSQKQNNADSSNTGSGSNAGTSNNGGTGQSTTNTQGTTPQFSDPEDQLEYEATMAVMDEIQASTAESLRSYVGSDFYGQASMLPMMETMPLGRYANNVEIDSGLTQLKAEYLGIDHNVDSDAIDNALAYDVVALMAVCPSLQSVQLTVNEDDDHDLEYDVYVFERTVVEELLGRATSNAITRVNDSLLESEDSWNQLRNYVATERFSDALLERAERS